MDAETQEQKGARSDEDEKKDLPYNRGLSGILLHRREGICGQWI